MLQSKYLTEDGLKSWLKECYTLGFKYVFYNPDNGICMLSEQEPVFRDTTFVYCDGKKYPIVSYFSTLVVKDLLINRNYIVIEDYIDVVDWENVPVDTLIKVRKADYEWIYRYFAKYEDGLIFTFANGATSVTAVNKDAVVGYKVAKLVK